MENYPSRNSPTDFAEEPFFKGVPDEFLRDPGEDLKRVIDFRESIIADKKVFFQSFNNEKEWEVLVRKKVTEFVNKVVLDETISEKRIKKVKSTSVDSEIEGLTATNVDETSSAKEEGFEFLDELTSRFTKPDFEKNLTACDVARFRLLANSISTHGNDEVSMGAHDLNVLFKSKIQGVDFGIREKRTLAELGLQYFSDGNVPFWYWYSCQETLIQPVMLSLS